MTKPSAADQRQPDTQTASDTRTEPVHEHAYSPWADGLGKTGARCAQLLLVAAVIAGLLWLLQRVSLVVIAVLVALILASAVNPLVRWLVRKGWSRLLATAATFVGILVGLGGVLSAIVLAVRDEWDELSASALGGWEELQRYLRDGPLSIDTVSIDAALQQATDFVTTGSFLGGALTGISAATGFLTGAVLMLVILFFFLKDGPKFWNFTLRWFRGETRAKLAESGDRTTEVLGGYVRGTAIIATVDAVFIGVPLALLGVPLALPLAIIVFLGAFVPIVGATVAGILAALVALVTNGVVIALVVIAIVIVVNQVEGDLLQPVVMGRTLSVNALVVLLALSVGTIVGGITGAVLAVPLTAVGWSVIQVWSSRYQVGHDPILGDDPVSADTRVEAKATMAERWKYERMRYQRPFHGRRRSEDKAPAEVDPAADREQGGRPPESSSDT